MHKCKRSCGAPNHIKYLCCKSQGKAAASGQSQLLVSLMTCKGHSIEHTASIEMSCSAWDTWQMMAAQVPGRQQDRQCGV